MDTIQIHYRVNEDRHVYLPRDVFQSAITSCVDICHPYGTIRCLPIEENWWFACEDPSALLNYSVFYAMESRSITVSSEETITLANVFCYTMQQIEDQETPGLPLTLELARSK
jgi:hypothetical protein